MFQPCPYTAVTRYSLAVYDRHIHLDGDFFKGRNNVFLDWYVCFNTIGCFRYIH